MNISQNTRKILSSVITAICITIICFFVYKDKDSFANAFKELNLPLFSIIILTIIIQIYCRIIRDHRIYRLLGQETRLRSLNLIYAKQNILNYLPMKAGTIYASAALKNEFGLPLKKFFYAFIAQNILTVAITLFMALIAFASLQPHVFQSTEFVIVLFCLFILFVTFGALIKYNKIKFTKIGRISDAVGRGLSLFNSNPSVFKEILTLNFISIAATSLRYSIFLMLFTKYFSISSGIIYAASGFVSLFLSITPAGLGIRESIFSLTSVALQSDPSLGLAISAIERVLILSIMFLIIITENIIRRLPK